MSRLTDTTLGRFLWSVQLWVVLGNCIEDHHELSQESSDEGDLLLVFSAPSVHVDVWLLQDLLNGHCLLNEFLSNFFLELCDLLRFSLSFAFPLSLQFGSYLIGLCLLLCLSAGCNHGLVVLNFLLVFLTSSYEMIADQSSRVLGMAVQFFDLLFGGPHQPRKDIGLHGVPHELVLEVPNISQECQSVHFKIIEECL